jgi:hypothetical protein
MDILAQLKDRLRFIERLYITTFTPFAETKRKIDAGESPFIPPYFDPDRDDPDEMPFQDEWEEADDALNLVGQFAVSLVQTSLRQYLDAFILLSGRTAPSGPGHWFPRYKQLFLDAYGVDWQAGPVPLNEIEELNLARNDIQHPGFEFGMNRKRSKVHQSRFPQGLFADVAGQALRLEDLVVSADSLREAIRRVECFCEFLDKNRNPYWSGAKFPSSA